MFNSQTKKLLLLGFCAVSFSVNAQIRRIDTIATEDINLKPLQSTGQRIYMYTIAFKAFSLEEFPKILNQVNSDEYLSSFGSGLLLKLNDNQISYRIAGNFYSKDITFKNECEECEEANGQMKDFSTRIGFEKNFVYGAVQPYLAFDVGYRRNSFEGEVKNATALNYTNPYTVNTLKNGLLMSPNLGFKINPVSHFTLALEAGMGLLYSYEKQERVYQDMNRTRTFNEFRKWEFLLRPVSMVSLQYNFGLVY